MYDEVAAKSAYLERLGEVAATQDLTEDQRLKTRNLSISFTVIATFFVGLRFFTRWRQAARIGIDDWLILFSLSILLGNMIMNLAQVIKQGLGLHSGAFTLLELQRLDKTILGAEILYVTGVNMYKISLLFMYFRVFPVRSIRTGGYICGGLSTCWNLACIMAATFQCTPRRRLWEPWLEGTCIDLFLTQLCISIPSILCDIAILCLPMPHVWRAHMSRTQRILITLIFLLGSYVVFTSVYRFRIFLLYRTDDIPWTLAPGCAWNIIEISSGVVSACLPTLGPLFRSLLSTIPKSLHGTSNPSSWRKTKSLIETIGGSGAKKLPLGPRDMDRSLMETQGCSSTRVDKQVIDGGSIQEPGIGCYNPVLVPYRGDITLNTVHARENSDGNLSDEIPLTTIRKHHNFG